MRWFGYAGEGTGAAEPVRAAFASVLRARDGVAAGGGVLLTDRHLLTCAHVVNDALGKGLLETGHPGGVRLRVAFPGSAAVRAAACTAAVATAPRPAASRAVPDGVPPGPGGDRPARLTHWIPPRRPPGEALEWHGDLAVLELDEPLPVPPPAWQVMAAGQEVRAWHGGGHPATLVEVTVKDVDGRVGYIDGTLSGAAIGPGYSGGPLWSAAERAVVGLVVARLSPPDAPFSADHVVRRGWAIPWQAVRRELAEGGAGALLPPDAPDAWPAEERGAVRHELVGPLAVLLPDPAARADAGRRLARQCGRSAPDDGTAPSFEELAAVLTEDPRALPTLTEVLAPAAEGGRARDAVRALHTLGALALGSRLLSYGEHRRLLALLDPVAERDPALLPAAARGALEYPELPEPVRPARLGPRRVAAAVAALEQLGDGARVPDGSPRVPALLKVAEYVAAALPGTEREALRGWSRQVARRLGIHRAALAERRADAVAWAGRRTAGGHRTVVRLARRPGDAAEEFRCTVWRERPDGTLSRASTGDDRPLRPARIAELIRQAAAVDDTSAPLVEVVVDRDALELPVDEWGEPDASDPLAGLFSPGALGAEFQVVLRCPELRHRSPTGPADLRRRWAGNRTEEPLVVDERVGDARALKDLLYRTGRRATGRVVVHGPAAGRALMLQVCLFLGVPVVLWDRTADGFQHAPRLDQVDPAGPLESLPERVRDFRVDVYADPGRPARPALVWENPDRPLPDELRLADPVAMTEES